MTKKLIIYFILISSTGFFNLIFLPSQIIFLVQFGVTGMMLLFIIVQHIYGNIETITHIFRNQVFLILTGVFLSMIIAQAYHSQNIGLTLWAQRVMYYYFLYFFLHFLKPDIKDLERILLSLGILYAVFYLVQYAIFPIAIFDVRQVDSRGTIRIFLPGASFLTFALFLSLHRFYRQNELRYLFLVLIFFAILVLMGTRNFLASVILVILYSLIFSKIIRSRYVIYFLILISMIPVYILFQDIFVGLIELSGSESEGFEDNIRLRAAAFFLTDFFPNKLAYIFGNGQDHGRSLYGMRIAVYKAYHGYYQSDIGIIGDFSKFGLFYVTGYLWLIIKVFRTKFNTDYGYIKYFFLLNIFTLPFGSAGPSGIAAICVLLYIVEKSFFNLKEGSLENNNNIESLDQFSENWMKKE